MLAFIFVCVVTLPMNGEITHDDRAWRRTVRELEMLANYNHLMIILKAVWEM